MELEQTAIKATSKSSNRLDTDYNNILEKAKQRGLEQVYEFLKDLSRSSKKTSLAFWYGLNHLDTYTKEYYKLDLQNIIEAINAKQIDVYTVLNSFIAYLQNESKNGSDLSARTIHGYSIAAKSYFEYCDIEIVDSKYKKRVRIPPIYREDEALDANDIREILNHCDNKRLKAYFSHFDTEYDEVFGLVMKLIGVSAIEIQH